MKKGIYLWLIIFLLSCSRTPRSDINGVVSGLKEGMIYLDEQEVEKTLPVDSMKLKNNGRFHFKVENEYPRFYNLHLGDQKVLPLLISPGDKISIKIQSATFNQDYTLEGSEGSMQIQQLNTQLRNTQNKLDSLRILYRNASVNSERQKELSAQFETVVDKQRKYTLEFVLNHMTSMASIYALYQKLDDETFVLYKNKDIQILKITGATLDTIYPESPHVKALVANARSLEDQVYSSELRNLIQSSESANFPEIALPDPDGDTIRLSSLKGKVILLSFWASWDQNSTNQNQYLVDLYNQYHNKGFEIYQVSLDYRKEAWIQAIQFEELPWINVCDLSYPESVIAGIYNVQSLPANYLINRSGVIVGKNLSINNLKSTISDLISQ